MSVRALSSHAANSLHTLKQIAQINKDFSPQERYRSSHVPTRTVPWKIAITTNDISWPSQNM